MPNDWSVSIPYGQDKVNSTVRHERALGTIGYTPDGRKFRWVFTNGAIGAGHVVTSPVPIAAHDQDMTVVSNAAIGAMTVTITVPTTAIVKDEWEDGYLIINDLEGEGHLYVIHSHPAVGIGANGVITLKEPIREALVASSTLVGAYVSRYKDVVDAPTTATNAAVGVLPTEFADNTYGWAQVSGHGVIAVSGTVVVGNHVVVGGAVGHVTPADYSGDVEDQIIGVLNGIIPNTTDSALFKLQIE